MAPTGLRTPLWPLLITFLLALPLLLLVAFRSELITVIKCLEHEERAPVDFPVRSTPGGPVPDFRELPRITTIFRERPILEDLSPSADTAWRQTVLTQRGGFLWVDFNQTSSRAWGISMFHALHCVQMLRDAIKDHNGMKPVVDKKAGNKRAGRKEHPLMDPMHLGHCIGYIAQHLMCAADSTIEPPWVERDDRGQVIDFGIDGEGSRHQCRDSSLLWAIAEKSEKVPLKPWDWQLGETVESVFG
ncbi:MAG: hypothetical protein Q9226_006010 [Calogaya cf. arnoldii]